MQFARFWTFHAIAALAGLVLLRCDDASLPATPPGADAADGASPTDDGGPMVHGTGDGGVRDMLGKPTVFVLDVRPQPNGGDPGFTMPRVVVRNEMGTSKRMPDMYMDSPKVGGVGLGCIAYDFSSADPTDPKGPGRTSGDMGTVTIDGYSGGTYVSGPMADAGVASPTTCTRAELAPGSGLLAYGCGDVANPATRFLQKSDTITVTASGGADVSAWTLKTAPSPYDDLEVQTDLSHVTPDMVDGTKDLTIAFSCGGADCTAAGLFIDVVLESSDGRDADAAAASAFDFPPAKKAFGVVECLDYVPLYKTSYTIDRMLLAEIPPTWTDLRITVATFKEATGQVDSHWSTLLGAGFGRFGITHR